MNTLPLSTKFMLKLYLNEILEPTSYETKKLFVKHYAPN